MTNLFRQMQRAWEHDGNSREARDALRRWTRDRPDLQRFDSPFDLVGACHDQADSDAHRSIDRLTEEAATDPWATRTVLHALLPGLARLARDHIDMVGAAREPFSTVDELDQFVVCTAFERITEVANDVAQFRMRTVVDTTWGRLRTHAKAHRREYGKRVCFGDTDRVPAPPSRTEAEELAELLVDAVERRLLRPVDAGLVYTTRVVGHSASELAACLEWQLPTLYRRRNRTEAVVIAEAFGRRRPRGHYVAPPSVSA